MHNDIVVVHHSGYGHTRRVADAAARGAKSTTIAIDAHGNVPDEAWGRLASARAIVFGSPACLASFSGLMTATPFDASVDELHPGNLQTAELFGKRVADIAVASVRA